MGSSKINTLTVSTMASIPSILIFIICVNSVLHFSNGSDISKDESFYNISLLNYNSTQEGHVVKDIIEMYPLQTLIINVENLPNDMQFIIIQTHAFQMNITLSYYNSLSPHSYVNGTNLGLVKIIDAQQSNAKFYLQNPNLRFNTTVLIALQAYGYNAPIPGGCNMEFSVETAPYQVLKYTESVVIVDSQQASAPSQSKSISPCESQLVDHEMYHMYLPEQDFTSETYFNALLKMMTVNEIQLNGKKVPAPMEGSEMRRVYSAYPGTGSVYAVIAKSGTSAAAYVPTLTYACSTVYWTDTCIVLNTTFSKLLCAVIFFLGLFVCLYGHQFFKTEMFLLGFLSGSLIFYILLALVSSLNDSVTIMVSVALGLCFGAFWLGLWLFHGIPVFSVLLATLTFGFVIAGITAYAWLGDIDILKRNLNFWVVYTSIVMIVPLLFISVIQKANMISCAVLGAYAVIIPIDHYIGSNLKYIIVNVIRRATVKEFRLAFVDPPFQIRDTVLCVVWIILAAVGIAIQWHKQRGKPPFPPPPFLRYRDCLQRRRFQNNSTNATERTPLLVEADIPPTRIPYLQTTGDDEVFESPNHSASSSSFFQRLKHLF